jgi:hypothetical protein
VVDEAVSEVERPDDPQALNVPIEPMTIASAPMRSSLSTAGAVRRNPLTSQDQYQVHLSIVIKVS